ncbi:hypothetical protein GCM10027346_15890 [Hymenobacter seoulensis]
MLLLLGLLGSGCVHVRSGPVGFWSRNRFDRGGEQRHGPWREYYDKEEQQLATRGRYRHGLPAGKWRTYQPSGSLERTEKFYRRPYGLVTISYFHPNNQLAKQGQARYRAEPSGARFFWFGEWKCYSTTGQRLPSEWYHEGVKVQATSAHPNLDKIQNRK